MQVKTFRQPTIRQALRAIREEFGPGALVLASHLVAARGWRGWLGWRDVVVTASAAAERRVGRPAAQPRRPADTSTPRDHLLARLLATGLAPAMAEATVGRLPPAGIRGASIRDLRCALAAQLESMAAGDEPHARVEVFVGPPGVGKTTTIAKIAAQARVRRGPALGLVGADAFRAGAVEQLRAYASIIGAPFRIARTLDDLDAVLAHGGRASLLVDTAGRSPADAGLRDLRRLLATRQSVRTHLVLAADTTARRARQLIEAYADLRPDRLVITKLDEAESVSAVLDAAGERALPVSYLTAGQRVPDDLTRATGAALADAVLGETSAGWAAA